MEVYLIRHTKPDIQKGVCYGQTDIGVATSFQDELETLKCKIPANFDRVYSSPLKRCRVLAEELTVGEISFREELMEVNFGKWEMQPWDDIPIEEVTTWGNHYDVTAPPDGEAFNDVYARASSVWSEIESLDVPRVAVVTHAGVIRCVLARLLDMPLNKSFNLALDYGFVSTIDFSGRCVQLRINE